jgi:hypothetical protein
MERKVPVLIIIVRVDVLMVPREAVAPRVIKPHVKALIREEKSKRVGPITAHTSRWVEKTVLVKYDWLLISFEVVFSRACPFWPVYPEDTIDVIVFSHVIMFLKWIPMVAHDLVKFLVLILAIGKLFHEFLTSFFKLFVDTIYCWTKLFHLKLI